MAVEAMELAADLTEEAAEDAPEAADEALEEAELAAPVAELEAEERERAKSKGMGGFLSHEQKKVFGGSGGLEERIRWLEANQSAPLQQTTSFDVSAPPMVMGAYIETNLYCKPSKSNPNS